MSLFNGRIVMIYFCDAPEQPLFTGVTVTVLLTGAAVKFFPVNEGTFPEPDAASPIDGLEFVQVKFTPVGVPLGSYNGSNDPSYTVVSDRDVPMDGTGTIDTASVTGPVEH